MEITLERLQECIDNKYPYFNKIELINNILLVEKYPFINTFDIIIVDKKCQSYIKNWYRDLGPFDTYNMIQELSIELY